MVDASRGLHRFQVWWFRVGFAEQFLPDVCDRLERARELALAGRTAEAGRKYQALLVASQVMQFAIAMHTVAQGAEIAGQPGGEITQTLDVFATQMAPILEAALSEDPRRIAGAIRAHPDVFRAWSEYLTQWPSRLTDAAEKVRVAKLVWDITFLIAAIYEAAGAAAEIAASGGPPVAPLPAFGIGGGAAAAEFSGSASIELVEAIRRLVASGALDAGVVAALSHTLDREAFRGASTAGRSSTRRRGSPIPTRPTTRPPTRREARPPPRTSPRRAAPATDRRAHRLRRSGSHEQGAGGVRLLARLPEDETSPVRVARRWRLATALRRRP